MDAEKAGGGQGPEQQVAVITGAGQGIGEAIAKKFAAAGTKVAVVDFNADSAHRVAFEIEADGGQALAVTCDVGERAQVNAAAQDVEEKLGPVSVLVNNAGISDPAMLWKMSEKQWERVFRVHVNGSLNWLQAVVPNMRSNKYGSIIFTTSAAGIVGSIGQINYAAAKAAQLGMMRSASKELAASNITVNAIAPNAATPMTETIRTDDRFREKYLSEIPLGRWAEPAEIASAYVFLAGPDARYITGQTISVDGGRVMMR